MKRLFLVTAVSAILMGGMLTSCKESTEDPEGPTPTVSISADAEFASDNTATVTLSLSEATSHDVTVALEDAEVQSGQTEVTVLYSKSVTIEAGQTGAEVTVTADVLGLEGGEYQAAIAIASAEGANVAESPVVYINFDYVEKPSVNLYADLDFPVTRVATMRARISAAYTEDITVTFEDDPSSTVTVSYEKTAVIPAGETEVEVPVTVNTDGLEPGNYSAVINMVSAENAVVGSARSVTINLTYPFSADVTIDGLFDEWDFIECETYTLPEGNVKYPVARTLKLAANTRDVYVYFEFDAPEKHGFSAYDINAIPYNFYIDPDGNSATGAYVGTIDNATAGQPFDPMGFTYYVEAALKDGTAEPFTNFYSSTIYRADCKVDGGFFWSEDVTLVNLAGTYDGEDIYGAGTYEDGLARIEVKLSREFFGITGTSFRFALKLMDGPNNWNAMGLLPQGETDAEGNFVPVDLASISLPAYAQ